MKEIIYDLLSVGKSQKTFTINPEVTYRCDLTLRYFQNVNTFFCSFFTLSFFTFLPEDEHWFASLFGDCRQSTTERWGASNAHYWHHHALWKHPACQKDLPQHHLNR